MGKPELGKDIGDVGDLDIELKSSRPITEETTPDEGLSGPFGIRVVGDVLDEIGRHVRVDTGVEQGGVLVGTVDEHTATTVVTGSIVAVGAISQVASLTFTHETWDHVNEVLADQHPGEQMVGWYHSHPRFGIFLSEYDQFIHNNFFPAAHHVAYVVDPVDDEHGFFGWEDGAITRVSSWETIRVEDGRHPEVDVGQPVRSNAAAVPGPAPVVIQTRDDGVRPAVVGLLVLVVALLVGAIAYALGSGSENDVASTDETVDPTPRPDPPPVPPPTTPPPQVVEPVHAVDCVEPGYWPVLRPTPDDAVLNGSVLVSGTSGLELTGRTENADGRQWVEVSRGQSEGWLPEAALVPLAAEDPAPSCAYTVTATDLNLREDPGVIDEDPVTVLPAGSPVTLTETAVMIGGQPWVLVDSGDLRGFVNGRYLELVISPEA